MKGSPFHRAVVAHALAQNASAAAGANEARSDRRRPRRVSPVLGRVPQVDSSAVARSAKGGLGPLLEARTARFRSAQYRLAPRETQPDQRPAAESLAQTLQRTGLELRGAELVAAP